MCWPRSTMHTNQLGQATRLWLCHCQAIQIRVFHITWFTFWLCFFGWFATSNLWPQIQQDLGLTIQDKAIAGGCSVASTVIFRVIIGWLCDKLGPKKSYVALLLVCVFPVAGMALVQTATGYIVVSLLIGIVGGAFVITQYHTTAMFAGKTVGTANATTAGWGNFGGGCANFFMPLLYRHFVETYNLSNSTAWRLCMLVPAGSYIIMSIVYWVFTVDKPPLSQTDKYDNIQSNANANANTNTNGSIKEMTGIPEEINLNNDNKIKESSSGGDKSALKIGATDYRTWILHLGYAACFGIELTVLRFAVGYLMDQFGLDQSIAGFIILCFSLCNLFARSIGGVVADIVSKFAKKSLNGRVFSLFIILLIESVFVIMFSIGALDSMKDKLGYTIFTLIMFSLMVQAAEGATFAIVPFVQPKAIGPIAGIVGAGGNLGAMIFAFAIFSSVPSRLSYFYAWLILGIFVFAASFTILFIRFSDEEIRNADEKMNTWTKIPDEGKNQAKFTQIPTEDEEPQNVSGNEETV